MPANHRGMLAKLELHEPLASMHTSLHHVVLLLLGHWAQLHPAILSTDMAGRR